jgi:uncharacterized protein YebE (UPF0316 family)
VSGQEFFSTEWFNYLVLPLLIFFARICDVTIGTLRIIFVSKGNKLVAPLLGFFEVLIWILAITRIIENLDNPLCYIAYAGGFATGNYIGLLVEERLAVGVVIIRIITTREVPELVNRLNTSGHGTTVVNAEGSKEKVNIIFSIVKRNDIREITAIIDEIEPGAFYSVEDVRMVSHGVFPSKSPIFSRLQLFKHWRKGI